MADEACIYALIVMVDATGLPNEVYEENDLCTLEEQIEAALTPAIGELDGNDMSLQEAEFRLYFFGPSPELILETIRPILMTYPLCKKVTAELCHNGVKRLVEL